MSALTAPTRLRQQLYMLVRPARTGPDLRAGFRAALSTAVPLLVASAFHPASATWASLAGFSVALADKGGAYRTRAIATGSLALSGAVAAMIGALVAHQPWLAVAVVGVWAAAATLVRVLGSSAMSVGISSTIILVISLAAPAHSFGESVARAVAVLDGSVWAMLLSLGFWPLRPYRPLRRAIASVYAELASHADLVASVAPPETTSADVGPLELERRHLRTQIENARELLVSFRRGGPAGSERGERMLVLVELADRLFGLCVAASDLMASTGDAQGREPAVKTHPRLRDAVAQTAMFSREMSQLVLLETVPDDATRERVATLTAQDPVTAVGGDPSRDEDALLSARLLATAYAALDTSANLETPEGARAHPDVIAPNEVPQRPSPLALLRASIGIDSLALHHALRVGIMMSIAIGLTHILPLGRGYWLTITVLLVLQPETGTTVIKVAQRVLGTLIGAGVTALVAMLLPGKTTVIALVIVLIFACVSLLQVNYLLYTAVMTPAFVLLAELSAGDWHLAGLRVENTLIGGALALLGARLLWPPSEHARFSDLVDASLRACVEHLREVARQWGQRDAASARALAEARRRAALAASNAESAFESMLVSTAEPSTVFEARMTALTYVRRLLVSDVALSTMRLLADAPGSHALIERLAAIAERALATQTSAEDTKEIEQALVGVVADAHARPALARQLERIARQMLMLRDALLRSRGERGPLVLPVAQSHT